MRTNARLLRQAALLILCATGLTACGPKVAVKATKPPPALLTCSAEPVAPELPVPGIERDRIVLAYLLAMRAAYGDCASKVAGVKSWADALP